MPMKTTFQYALTFGSACVLGLFSAINNSNLLVYDLSAEVALQSYAPISKKGRARNQQEETQIVHRREHWPCTVSIFHRPSA